jgi:hypothetical protein
MRCKNALRMLIILWDSTLSPLDSVIGSKKQDDAIIIIKTTNAIVKLNSDYFEYC